MCAINGRVLALLLCCFTPLLADFKEDRSTKYEPIFFNVGVEKRVKDSGNLENAILKPKVEVLGQVLKKHVQRLKATANKKVDLLFLVDSSASVGAENFFNELKFVKKLLADFTVSYDTTRVCVVTFSSKNRVVRHIDHLTAASFDNHKCRLLELELPSITYTGGGTYTLGAMLEAQKVLRSARPEAVQAVFLITDGYSNGGDPRPVAYALQRQGVEFFTFGIRNGNVRELYEMASEPAEEHSYILDSFEEFEALARRALHEDLHIGSYFPQNSTACDTLCVAGEDCCDSQAQCTCGTHTGYFSCLCEAGYYGTGLRNDCHPCPAGTYHDGQRPGDVTVCTPCTDPNHVSFPGSTSVADCQCKKGFIPDDTKCQVITCPVLNPPHKGYFVKNSCENVFNAACGVRCEVGYKLVGSSIRLCQENGTWSGEDATCIMKSCPTLKVPNNGNITCNKNNNSIDTVCEFTCKPGYNLVGSSKRVCLPIAVWNGLQAFCKPIFCPPLRKIRYGSIKPAKCASVKQKYGEVCEFVCEEGFVLKGESSRKCEDRGKWNGDGTRTRCIDVTPPTLECPEDIMDEAIENEDYAMVNWTMQEITDNSGVAPFIMTVPSVELPMKFKIGTVTVIYIAEDARGNVASCNFSVTVLDTQPPVVDSCESPPIYLAKDPNVTIEWDEPIFSDNSGQPLKISRSHEPGVLPIGNTYVTYVAEDDSGNNSTCTIAITVQEHECTIPMDPLYGSANCSENEDGVYCTMTCKEGYAFAIHPDEDYFCAYDGVWQPETNPFPVPDCSVTTVPNTISQSGIISMDGDDSICNDPFVLDQVENHVKRKLDEELAELCGDNMKCEVKDMKAACEALLSVVEEEFNTVTGFRKEKRSIEQKVDETESNTEAKTHLEHQQINTSQVFTYETQHPEKTTPTSLEGNRIDIHFVMLGQLSNEDMEDLRSVLKEGMEGIQTSLETTVSHGKFVILIGNRNFTANKVVFIHQLPHFVCEAGSVLQGERCVLCAVGTFFNVILEKCQPCEKGLYQPIEGQLSCLACPNNSSTRVEQAKSESDCRAQCLPGSFSEDGLESCTTCEVGSYQPEYGQKHCKHCPENTTTLRRGSRILPDCRELCPVGFVSENGLVPCYPCPEGYFQPLSGQKLCFKCPTNTRSNTVNCSSISANEVEDLELEQLVVNDCFSLPCLNGASCNALDFGYVCKCLDGYTGILCELEINECEVQPCLNEGICADSLSNYSCTCAEGFTGYNCEIDVDECASNPCMHGSTCYDQPGGFICECLTGYTGVMCEVNIDDCFDETCTGNGICEDLVGDFRCNCSPGFTGLQCEENVDECLSDPCHNGAVCVDGVNGFRCECPFGFNGTLCEENIDDCSSSPCSLGGTCIDLVGRYRCLCPPSYTGINCDNQLAADFFLNFVAPGTTSYAALNGLRKPLNEVTLCFWLKTSDKLNYGTPFSYSTAAEDNAFTVTDYNGFVLYVNGNKAITDVTANDNQWHYICIVWSSFGGEWKMFKDGTVVDFGSGLANGTIIEDNGALVLGQEQDAKGGGFSDAESFVGLLAHVDVWDHAMGNEEVEELTWTCERYLGTVWSWPDFLGGLKGQVEIQESVFCGSCLELDAPLNGDVSFSGEGKNSLATYKCDLGFTIKGNAQRQCKKHGNWDGHQPLCIRLSCGFPGYFVNGRIEGHRYYYGDEIRYYCNPGYQLDGPSMRVCGSSGTWSGQTPVCEVITCDTPEPPTHGEVKSSKAVFQFGDQIEVVCSEGYLLDGPRHLTCLQDGHWDDIMPACQPLHCNEPPRILNGFIVNGDSREVGAGEMLVFGCKIGYHIIGSSNITCTNEGTWEGKPPKCQLISCGSHPEVENATITGEGNVYNSTVVYECTPGFVLKGQKSVTCGETGEWSFRNTKCVPVKCGKPEAILNGDVSVSGYLYNSKVEYTCNNGYTLIGSSDRLCSEDSTWKPEAPRCVNVTCGSPRKIHYGSVIGGNSWEAGAVIKYACDDGYILVGPLDNKCLESGMWSNGYPECVPIQCPHPGNIVHGNYILTNPSQERNVSDEWLEDEETFTHITDNGFFVNSQIEYVCDEGYKLMGHPQLVCLQTQAWSGTLPTCKEITCPSLNGILNGHVMPSGFTFGSVAKYECDFGYGLIGTSDRHCIENGTWSDEEPSCDPVQCPDLSSIENGTVIVASLDFRSTAYYECDEGYILKGSRHRTCNHDGRWSGYDPFCLLPSCNVPEAIDHGYFTSEGDYHIGSIISYGCNEGYKLIGKDFQACRKNGEWKGKKPMCVPSQCQPINFIYNGRVFGNAFSLGARIHFTCNPGYVLKGSSAITCLERGWDRLPPACLKVSCPAPGQIANGHMLGNSFQFKDKIEFRCSEGFQLIGEKTHTCLANGRWSGTLPLCVPAICRSLRKPPDEVPDKSLTLYLCESKRRPVSEMLLGCNPGISVNLSQSLCRLVTCPVPPLIERGTYSSDNNVEFQPYSQVVYSCDPGYRTDDSTVLTCRFDGTWNSTPPACISKGCSELRPVENGKLIGDSLQVGSAIEIVCDLGYMLVGSRSIKCLADGTWYPAQPSCRLIKCSIPEKLRNGHEVFYTLSVGSQVHYYCDEGYLLTGRAVRRCLPTGLWDGDLPVCKTITCPSPPQIDNGMLAGSTLHYGDVATYACEDGYVLKGSENVTCLSNGQWSSPNFPLCEPVTCSLPPEISQGTRELTKRRHPKHDREFNYIQNVYEENNKNDTSEDFSFQFCDIVEYSCQRGYGLIGSETIHCTADGQWSGNAPSCISIKCQPPTSLNHGEIAGDDFRYNSEIHYLCKSGYILIGPEYRRCLANGLWSSAKPYCRPVKCNVISEIKNGFVNVSGNHFGATITYHCNNGYKLTGNSYRTCLSSGAWSGQDPICEPVMCPEPETLLHGRVIEVNREVGSLVKYVCDYGFEMLGSNSAVCLQDKAWSHPTPQCQPITCTAPFTPQNGIVRVHSLSLRSSVRYYCREGFRLVGPVSRTCLPNRLWSGLQPKCIPMYCPSLVIANSNISFQSYGPGSVVHVMCASGFYVAGAAVLTCHSSLKWDLDPPTCERVPCGEPAAVQNGHYRADSFFYLDKVELQCDRGFILKGSGVRECNMTGHWSGPPPECIPVECPQPQELLNGQMSVFSQSSGHLAVGSSVVYFCDGGYSLQGSRVHTCDDSGLWIGDTPVCTKAHCGSPPYIPQATFHITRHANYQEARYQCRRGYFLLGPARIQCHDGQWEQVRSKCELVSCGEPPPLTDGKVEPLGLHFGSSAKYACEDGFMLKGSESISCLENGKWSSQDVQCEPVPCSQPEVPENGYLFGVDFTYRSTVDYDCEEGFVLRGEASRFCDKNGQWNGTVPSCQMISCPEPPPLAHGTIRGVGHKYQDVIRFTCYPGYTMQGPMTSICDSTGHWSVFPLCKSASCDVPPAPYNAEVRSYSGNFTFGSKVIHSCKEGFVPNGDLSSRCQSDGQWSYVSGTCTRVSCGKPKGHNGAVILGTSYLYQDRVAYSCPPGRRAKSHPVIVCMSDGKWNFEPECETVCSKRCVNGGVCAHPNTCGCLPGYTGDTCQYVACILPCLNGGTCIAPFQCLCKPRYTGTSCEFPICEPRCRNGGSCVAPNTCQCLPGFSPPFCEEGEEAF